MIPLSQDAKNKTGALCKRIVDAMIKAKKRFNESGSEINRYGYAPDFNFEYQKLAPQSFFRAKVAKTAEAIQLLVPEIAPSVPKRLVTPYKWVTPQSRVRSMIMQDLQDYAICKTNFNYHNRKKTEEAIVWGRGVLWTSRDAKTGIVTSRYDSVRNLFVDANATTTEDIQVVARRRVIPKWVAKQEFASIPGAAQEIDKLKEAARRYSDQEANWDWEKRDVGSECVGLYEIWFNTGIFNFQGGSEVQQLVLREVGQPADGMKPGQIPVDNTPMKYVIGDNGEFIGMGPWEAPLHLINEFPCTMLDFYGNADQPWPISPLEPGIGYQRAMNWIVTFMMGKFRYTSKTLLAMKKQNGQGVKDSDKDRILIGKDIEAIEIDIKGDTRTLKDFLEKFEWGHEWIGAGLEFLDAIEERFERAVGLYKPLYTGEGPTQSRSARDTAYKEERTRSRINDMNESELACQSKLARKEAFLSRYLYDRNDVGRYLGPDAAQNWGFLARTEATDPQYWVQQYLQQGFDTLDAQGMAMQQAANAVTIDSVVLENEFEVEGGSQVRRTVQQQIDALRDLQNQAASTWAQSPNPAIQALAFDASAALYKLLQIDDDLVAKQKAVADTLRQMAMAPPPGMQPGPPAPAPQGAP
jgi:hypothetical protein